MMFEAIDTLLANSREFDELWNKIQFLRTFLESEATRAVAGATSAERQVLKKGVRGEIEGTPAYILLALDPKQNRLAFRLETSHGVLNRKSELSLQDMKTLWSSRDVAYELTIKLCEKVGRRTELLFQFQRFS